MVRASRTLRALAVAAVMVTAMGMAAPAGAQTAPASGEPEVFYVAPVVVVYPNQPDLGYIVGVYRCFGGEPIHLWVSAKQGGPDPSAEGGGITADAWYDTNVLDAPPVVCDGQYRVAFVPIGRHMDQDRLHSGQAWVQFCLVDEERGIVASQQFFATVIGV